MPNKSESIINVSTYQLTEPEKSLLNYGLNFSVKRKINPINRKIEMEKLFYDITKYEKSTQVKISDKEDLKIKFRNFAVKYFPDKCPDNLTPEQLNSIKTLQNNPNIVIQRADKGGGTVVMDKSYYIRKLTELIDDDTKFVECDANKTSKVKKKINDIAKRFKETNESMFKLLKRTGEFNNGHLYGLPKIHKNVKQPPLRPIISMTGTVTHDIAQYLNSIIRPYLNSNYIVKSSNEFLMHINNVKLEPGQQMLSLDVESLFTNVPVEETTDIILQVAFNHESLPPPCINQETLRDLLLICTTETPFQFQDKVYLQINGNSMGSPLGPTYADFYMSSLENNIMSQKNEYNPSLYLRYVDDIFTIFDSESDIARFVNNLQNSSVLKFTTETMKSNTFNFLDVKLTVDKSGCINTGVFIKPTDKGLYPNFKSHTLLRYKKSILKSLFHRAITHSSSWEEFHVEAKRLKQIFINNDFPLNLIDKVLSNVLDNYNSKQPDDNTDTNYINFYVQLDNLYTFKPDEKTLKQIFSKHVHPCQSNTEIKVQAYFKPSRLSSYFSTREKKATHLKTNVVYSFNCTEGSCKASYIGYTTNSVLTRCKQHRYNPSSIYHHYNIDHHMAPPHYNILINNFKILYSSLNLSNLRIAEAILIKKFNPFINVKYNEAFNYLTLF